MGFSFTCAECGNASMSERRRTKFCSVACAQSARRTPSTLAQRFKGKYVVSAAGCWVWTGTKLSNGYGRIQEKTKGLSAHRVSWELSFGPIPEGAFVCHTCDVPACVNPAHLFLGTPADNMRDMINKGRNRLPLKLSDSDVQAIRAEVDAGGSKTAIAAKWNICREYVYDLAAGKRSRVMPMDAHCSGSNWSKGPRRYRR